MVEQVGEDVPGDREVVDVLAGPVGEGMTSVVTRSAPGELTLTVAQSVTGRRARLEPGERLQLVWQGPGSLRGVPVELVAVTLGEHPTWDVRVVGEASRVQRREAVRAPLRVPVRVSAGGDEQPGWTADVSEGGLRCLFAAAPAGPDGGTPARAGDRMRLTLQLAGAELTDEVALVRPHPRPDRVWEVSVRFTGLSERDQDAVRAAVFAELRARAARGLS